MTLDFPEQPFTWACARQLGISRHRLVSALQQRAVVRLFRNVYARADATLSIEERLRAARHVMSPYAVACDRTAAWIWGVDCFEWRELDQPPPLETVVLRGHRATNRPQVRGGSRDLLPRDWVQLQGVRVTRPLRTALDLGCSLNRRPALAVLDAFMREHGITRAQMVRELRRYRRRRGVVQCRELVSLADPRAESPGESWMRLEILDAGLAAPEPQWWVVICGVPTYRLDLAYPHARIVIEYDGEEFHSSDEDRAADEARRAWLRQHGWTVIVLDKHSFTDEAIRAWTGELRDALAATQQPSRRWYVRH